jgi:RNA-dependent RNA polymerase
MDNAQLAKLRACAAKLRLLAQEDPQIDLIARVRPHWKKEDVTPAMLHQMYSLPDLSKIRFRTRTLIEGLIGLGTLKPGEVPELMRALQQHAIAPAFQERLLESLFMLKEDRIRDVNKVVAGQLYCQTDRNIADDTGKARFLRTVAPPQLSHLVMIRNVLVTPTRVLIGPPQQEPSNSVTRRYQDKLDGIARVTFTDEEDRLFVSLLFK